MSDQDKTAARDAKSLDAQLKSIVDKVPKADTVAEQPVATASVTVAKSRGKNVGKKPLAAVPETEPEQLTEDTASVVGVDVPDAMVAADAAGNDSGADNENENDEPSIVAEDAVEVQRDLVIIHSTKCMKCSHLYQHGTRAFESCHFSNGNDECPAQFMRIAIGVNFQKAAQALADAMHEKDAARLARISVKMESLDASVQRRVFDLAEQRLSAMRTGV